MSPPSEGFLLESKMYKVWLLKFPLHSHYEESEVEIVELANKANLEIIDARFASDFDESHLVDMSEEPALKPKGEKKEQAQKDEFGTLFDPELHEPEMYQRGENKGKWKPKK